MTTLAAGQNASVTLGDNGSVRVASNGGFWSAVVTPTAAPAFTRPFGPLPVRTILGPFSEGASVVITSDTAPLAYDTTLEGSGSGSIAVGGMASLSVAAGASLPLASNFGFFTAQVTPVGGSVRNLSFGPEPIRTTLGPFDFGATVNITSTTAAVIYENKSGAVTPTDMSLVQSIRVFDQAVTCRAVHRASPRTLLIVRNKEVSNILEYGFTTNNNNNNSAPTVWNAIPPNQEFYEGEVDHQVWIRSQTNGQSCLAEIELTSPRI